jgi:glycerol-3-phosphate dehydrogenase (NAD(P)+)
MNIGMIGLGNLGTAVGDLVARNGHRVIGWEYHPPVVEEINAQHTNSRFLEGVALHPELRATIELTDVFAESEIVFIALPSVFIESTLRPVQRRIRDDILFVNMAKGINRETGLTSFQTLARFLPANRRIMLSGPSIANEFARGMPAVVVLAGDNDIDLIAAARVLDNDYFRTRFSDDAIGVELGGILKNIYAIGLGMFDGRQITSINFRAVYLTIALEEIARIGVAMGARLETFLYLAGMGDLLATSLSEHSHNRYMGELLAQGLHRDEIRERMGVLPEGFNALKVVLYVAEKLHVSLPLARGLWDIINGRYEVDRFITVFIKGFVE